MGHNGSIFSVSPLQHFLCNKLDLLSNSKTSSVVFLQTTCDDDHDEDKSYFQPGQPSEVSNIVKTSLTPKVR